MGAVEQFNKPAWGNAIDTDLDAMRDNLNFLLVASVIYIDTGTPIILPGWDTTVTPTGVNYARPTAVILTRGTRAIHLNYTWSTDSPDPGQISSITVCYDDGVTGQTCFDAFLLYYNDNGDFVGTVEPSPNTPSGDSDILWGSGDVFTAHAVETAFDANCNLYFYEGSNGQPGPDYPSSCGYYSWNGSSNDWLVQSVIVDAETPFSTGEFIVKFDIVDVVTGHGIVQLKYTTGREGQWWEMFRQDIRLDDEDADGTVQEVVVDVSVGRLDSGDPDAGTAVPVAGSVGVVRVTLKADRRTP